MIREKVNIDSQQSDSAILHGNRKHKLNNLILKYVRKGPVLDVGCGDGSLLNVLKDKFEVEGFDPSEKAIKVAKSKGLNVKVSTINTFQPPPEKI